MTPITEQKLQAHLQRADALQRQGRLTDAEHCLRNCLHDHPAFPEAHFNLGNVLAAMRRPAEAQAHFAAALRLRPDFAAAHNNLGVVLQAAECVDEAVEHFAEATRLQPRYAEAHHNLGNALRDQTRATEAIAAYRRAIDLAPQYSPALVSLAETFLEIGDTEQAQVQYRAALRLHPGDVRALLGLAANGFYTDAEPGMDRLVAALRNPSLSLDVASHLHFILGYLLERAGEPDRAFVHFLEGNARRRLLFQQAGRAFDRVQHTQYVDRLIDWFSQAYFRQPRELGLATEKPVFIVGMPRSGTTLVEQILSQHSQVHGAGELKGIGRIVSELTRSGGDYPECLGRLDVTKLHPLAQSHLDRLTQLGGEAERVTDKRLDNVEHLGLIATLFPGARVIHCRRDPRDVCVSCFRQFFQGLNFSWDLRDLGHYYRDYERLMRHWQSVLPLPIHEVVYETLVTNQEAESRRLVGFLGLPWEERCLRFHENPRAVQTLSKTQVRQPLYTTSLGRWQRYAAHLQPLFEALAEDDP